MIAVAACPNEAELLPVAMGEPAEVKIAGHLLGCPRCRDRLERLRIEIASLRGDVESGEIPASIE